MVSAKLQISHWSLSLEKTSESRKERSARYMRLKEMGFVTPYFQYPHKDEKAKARAKVKAQTFAECWEAKSGFKFEIHEGCFL